MHILDRPEFKEFINTPTYADQPYLFHEGGSKVDWYEMDTEDRFKENLKKYPNNKHLEYYLENPHNYRLNRNGFRSNDEFETKAAGNVFLGCSHTFGIGHSLENTWSYLVNKEVGGKFFNLSIPGTGSGTALRTLLAWYTKLNIKNIFHFAPLYPRYEHLVEDKYITLNCTHSNFDTGKLKHTLIHESSIRNYTLTNILAIQAIATKLNIPYYSVTDEEAHNRHETYHDDEYGDNILARDLVHYSTSQHKLFSEIFLERKASDTKHSLYTRRSQT